VYATLPVGGIIGAFSVTGQETYELGELWDLFGEIAGIEYEVYLDYYRTKSVGTCLLVGDVFATTHHIDIKAALGLSRPPQSFQYVDSDCAKDLIKSMQPVKETVLA
jgi:predicted transcriptional regulator